MHISHEIKLINFVEASLGRPFAWGQCDCNTFVLAAMDAVYDTALAAKILGKYSTGLGAIRYRRRSPWGSLIALLREAGFSESSRGFEQIGDILIVADKKWEMSHVCLGNRGMAAFPDEGVQFFPLSSLADQPYTVWRSPCPPQ